MMPYSRDYPDPFEGEDRDGAVTVRLSDVEPELLRWLWPGRLPVGKLSILEGDPSVGKSTVAVDWAARVSTGAAWPDGSPCPHGSVLVLSAEDGLADTIRPRLDAAGGDPSRVHALVDIRFTGEDGRQRTRSVTMADVEPIERAIREHKITLLIIDVLMAYLPSKTDSHKDQDIRSVLAGVAAMADRTGCTILLLRHLNKTGGGSPIYRGGGSIGIVGAARSAFLAASDPDAPDRRVLAVVKSNLAAEPEALAYRLIGAENGCARVQWEGATAHTAHDLLAGGHDDDERTARDEAVEWLTAYLADNGGEASPGDVKKAARADGISERTLERARSRGGITLIRTGFPARSLWRLDPAASPQSRQTRHTLRAGETGETAGDAGETGTAADLHEDRMGSGRGGAGTTGHRAASTDIGPCATCGTTTRRYGEGGAPLCEKCRGAAS